MNAKLFSNCVVVFVMTLLVFVGCSTVPPEAKAAAQKLEADKAARPDRLEIVSQELALGRYTFAVIIKDTKTEEEFIIVQERIHSDRIGSAVAITPIRDER